MPHLFDVLCRKGGSATKLVILSSAKDLLLGIRLGDHFSVSYADSPSTDATALRLDPRQKQRDYDWLILVVDLSLIHI